MLEKLSWIYEHIQQLEGVPVNERNVNILFLSMLKLKEVYDQLKGDETNGEESAENGPPPDPR